MRGTFAFTNTFCRRFASYKTDVSKTWYDIARYVFEFTSAPNPLCWVEYCSFLFIEIFNVMHPLYVEPDSREKSSEEVVRN